MSETSTAAEAAPPVNPERTLLEIAATIKAVNESHASNVAALRAQYVETSRAARMKAMQLDDEAIALAESILEIGGDYAKAGDEKGLCVQFCIQQLLIRGGQLFEVYSGTKHYDRWRGQHVICGYGLAPRHGGVIFSIGLKQIRRQDPIVPLTVSEIDACVYYLRKLQHIHDAARASREEASTL